MTIHAVPSEARPSTFRRADIWTERLLSSTGTKDLLNPEFEPINAARYIRDVRIQTISPGTVSGHAAAGGAFPADVDFLNRQIGDFLDTVTNRGKTLQ